MTTVCVTFDHLGSAQQVGRGSLQRRDPDDPGATIGYPRVLRLLDELDLRATFFIEGWSLLHYFDTVADLIERGHEVGLHGWVHERWSGLDAGEQERILADGRAVLDLLGVDRPGFRAPHGVLAPQTAALLAELGYRYDSSLLDDADEPPRRPRPLADEVVNVPFAWPMVDAWQYKIRPHPLTPDQLTTAWTDLVQPHNGLVTLVAHPHISGVDPEAATAFESVLRTVARNAADAGVQVRRLGDVADEFRAATPPPVGAPADDWMPYLRARHLSEPGDTATELSGGVSCVVLRTGETVVKQARDRLAVAGDWSADPARVLAEATALDRFPGLAPERLDVDTDHLVLAMRFVDGVNWKDELLAGRVDLEVGRLAGAALRRIAHTAPAGLDGPSDARRFAELRLDPYFGGLAAAMPELGRDVDDVVARLRRCTTGFVHGDFSPKNVLVRRATRDAARTEITVLDWEVACAGDPTFDVAFLLTHLVVKSIHLPAASGPLRALCRTVLTEYGELDETWLARLLGALLLARVEGLSTLTYLSAPDRAEVRSLGASLLTGGTELPWQR